MSSGLVTGVLSATVVVVVDVVLVDVDVSSSLPPTS